MSVFVSNDEIKIFNININDRIALKFDRHLGSAADEMAVQLQSHWKGITRISCAKTLLINNARQRYMTLTYVHTYRYLPLGYVIIIFKSIINCSSICATQIAVHN